MCSSASTSRNNNNMIFDVRFDIIIIIGQWSTVI